MKKLALCCLCALTVHVCAFGTEPPNRPLVDEKLQYESDGIAVSIPTKDEPRVEQFNRSTIQAAVKYLDNGALAWVREKGCINCHTTGPYMVERSALSRQLGMPNKEIHRNFVADVPDNVTPVKAVKRGALTYVPRSYYAVWRSLGLAEWDLHITGTLSDATERSIADMFARQSANGSFVSYGEVEIPHITTDFELTLQAAKAIATAPGWLGSAQAEKWGESVENMKNWLRSAKPKNDFDRVLRLQLAHYFPELVSDEQKQDALSLLTIKQHTDGGWCIRDMSDLEDWHYEISDYVAGLVENLPDAKSPQSDPYMTALAIVLLRQAGVEAADERIQRGVRWLKREQRVSGRWWMHSLYRGNYHYITYIATCQALKALALCGELEN